MDPITLAITAALASLSQDVIKDAYAAFKAALQDKCGVSSKLVKAVDELEATPESQARKAVIQEEVTSSKVDQDPELLQMARALIEQVKKLPGSKVDIKQDVNIKGNRNIVSGQGDVTVNE